MPCCDPVKKILIRCDASETAGAGHLMRSIALAQHLQSSGGQVRFITKPWRKELTEYLVRQKFDIRFLDLAADDLGRDADRKVLEAELRNHYDWVVLDNYYFGHDFEGAVRGSGTYLLRIDERKGESFDADILVNYALDAANYPPQPKVGLSLLGPDYMLLRRELLHARRPKNGIPRNILVTFGGSDQSRVLQKTMTALKELRGRDLQIKAVTGFSPANASSGEINSPNGIHIEMCRPELDFKKYYEWADLAICAAGGTAFELCYFGITGITGALIGLQQTIAKELADRGVFISVGRYDQLTPSDLAANIEGLLKNPEQVSMMSDRGMKLIDGRGPERIFAAMQQYETSFPKINQRSHA